MVRVIAHVYPAIMTNETLLHLKYGVSMLIYTARDLLLPLLGIPFALYVMFHGKTKEYILDTMSRAAVLAASMLCLYFSDRDPVAAHRKRILCRDFEVDQCAFV